MKKCLATLISSITILGLLLGLGAVSVMGEGLKVQMIVNDQGYQYLTKEFLPKFEQEHGVQVTIERVGWGNRMDKLLINTAGGTPPDLFMSGAEHVKELVEAGLLASIDEHFTALPDRNDFFPPALGSSSYQGTQYGLPIYTSPRVYWYRTDLFEEAGLDANHPPTNWSELLEAAKRLTRTDGTEVTRQGLDLERWTGSNRMSNFQEFYMFLVQNGGRLFDPQTFKAEFDGPLGIEALEFMTALRDAVQPPGYSLNLVGGAGNRLYRGASVIRVDTSAIIRDFYNPGLDLTLADQMRAIVPPPGQEKNVTVVYSDWLGIHAQSPNKELAWEFLKAFTSSKVLRDYNMAAGYQSPRRSTYRDFAEKQPMVRYVYESLNYAVPFPVFGSPDLAMDAFNARYRAVIRREEGPQSALPEAARIWNLTVK